MNSAIEHYVREADGKMIIDTEIIGKTIQSIDRSDEAEVSSAGYDFNGPYIVVIGEGSKDKRRDYRIYSGVFKFFKVIDKK